MKRIKNEKFYLFILSLGGKLCAFIIIILMISPSCKSDRDKIALDNKMVRPGLEIFLEKHLYLVKGKRVGFVTNPTSVNSQLKDSVTLFYVNSDINLVALYGPEHGVRGNAQAGEYVPFYLDQKFNIPVFSLYGQSRKPEPGMLINIDEYMRTFDTEATGKIPESSMVRNLDVMLFDIQDVGTRIYTYIATMAYCMEACAENKIEFIILDRPNPINGKDMEGPILEYPEYSSFVGLYPIPVRHGMTAGELSLLFNDRLLEKKVKLTVVAMEGWEREMWYDETTLPWIIPSPNLPTLETANVYPGQAFLEGTNISEGRGTTKPFEIFGAPWIDGYELAKKLNALNLSGVKFREAWFKPIFSKYQGELCGGAQVHVSDRNKYKPFKTSLLIIKTIRDMYPEHFYFHEIYFDKIMGTSRIREALEENVDVEDIIRSCEAELREFSELRSHYLLY